MLFHKMYDYILDELARRLVNHRAKLVTGSLVSVVMSCDQKWANDVIMQLESLTGIHGLFSLQYCNCSFLTLSDLAEQWYTV